MAHPRGNTDSVAAPFNPSEYPQVIKGDSVNGFISELIRADMGMSEDDWKKQDETPEE